MEVWWFAPGDGVHGAFWYDDGKGWRGPYQQPGPVGPASAGGIAAASRIATSMETWWIGADLSVRGDFWYDDGNGWQPYRDAVAAPTVAAPTTGMAALSRIDTSMEIWWIGLGGTVQGAYWYQDQNNNAWQRYTLTNPGTASDQSGVAAVSRIPAAMEIWWVGPHGSVEGAYWYATDPDPQWRRYQLAPDGSAAQSHGIAAVSRKPTNMDVVWITPDGGVKGAYWNEGDVWQPYPAAVADAASASLDGGLAAVSRGATGLEVWWIGPDGSVQGAAWTDSAGWHRYADPVAPKGSAATTSGIAAIRKRQIEERFAAGSRWRETGLVFTSTHGSYIEPRNANRLFHDWCGKAGVPQLRVHDLRHSCATLLFTMGVQPATVQRILRHSSITVTTGTYVEVIEAVQRDALDSMGSLFGVGPSSNASY
jgi:hypothetical protein